MPTNSYFVAVHKRENVVRNFFYGFFLKTASYPKLLIEVFIRRNFGERYFRLSSAITVLIIFLLLPLLIHRLTLLLGETDYELLLNSNRIFWKNYTIWYIFLGVFLVFSIIRKIEQTKNPSTLEFKRFSLYNGDMLDFFALKIVNGKLLTQRFIETLLEPAAAFAVGFILALFGQSLGWLLMVSAIFYGMSYAAAYNKGDDFIMDKIDEIIMNEEMENAFVNDEPPSKTRGVKFYASRPDKKHLREKLVDMIVIPDYQKEEITFAE